MKDSIKSLRNDFIMKLIISIIISSLIGIVLLIFGIKYNNILLYLCFVLSYLIIFPLLFLLLNKNYNYKKELIINNNVNDIIKDLKLDYSYYKEVDDDFIKELKLEDISSYFKVSNVLTYCLDDKYLESFIISYASFNKKKYIGRIIHIKNLNINIDLSFYDYDIKKVKNYKNEVFILISKEQKNKNKVFSWNPLDYKDEIKYYNKLKEDIDFIYNITK